MDDEVVAAKSRRQAAEVLPESDMVRWCSSDCLCKGSGQQALRHNSVTFFKQGDCISLSLSLSLSAAAFSLHSLLHFRFRKFILLLFRNFAFFSASSSSVPSPCSSTPLSLSQSQHHSHTHTRLNLVIAMPDVHSLVNDFLIKLKKRKIEGSQATAKQTAELIRSVISAQRVPYTNQAGALIDAVKAVGEQLIAANPIELAVGNIVRRVLHIIREEDLSLTTAAMAGLNMTTVSDDEDDGDHDNHSTLSAAVVAAAARSTLRPPSLQTLLEDIPDVAAVPHTSSSGGDSEEKTKSADKSSRSRKLKHDVIEAVNELIQDIGTCHEQIAEQAVEHIHHNEVILTLGSSRTVLEFLCAAKEKKRSFRVFVAEGAPRYQGHLLAKELVARGLQTTLITDSAVFAMISRVNMVIVGAHAVMANGGVIAPVGLNMVALAAQRHAVPFVVLAGSHKLCPLYPHNPEVLLNELRSPSELLDFGEFSDCMDFGSGTASSLLQVVNPTFDYVPPKLVSLFITDTGGHNPSYMYRLIADYYSADDLVVQRRPV